MFQLIEVYLSTASWCPVHPSHAVSAYRSLDCVQGVNDRLIKVKVRATAFQGVGIRLRQSQLASDMVPHLCMRIPCPVSGVRVFTATRPGIAYCVMCLREATHISVNCRGIYDTVMRSLGSPVHEEEAYMPQLAANMTSC